MSGLNRLSASVWRYALAFVSSASLFCPNPLRAMSHLRDVIEKGTHICPSRILPCFQPYFQIQKGLTMNFNSKDISNITGLSFRQIDFWDGTHFIKPSVSGATGYGFVRLCI
jgi:hypothetical protein